MAAVSVDAQQANFGNSVLKETVTERFCHYQVDAVDFCALSADEISRYGEIEVLNREYYDLATQTPLPLGSLDRRLGSSSKNVLCQTCGQRMEDCVGHFGHVRLALPVFHVGFLSHIFNILHCICKTCGRVIIKPDERKQILAKLRRPTTDDNARKAIHKRVVATCKKVRRCPWCQAYNGMLKRAPGVPVLLKHQVSATQKGTPDDVSQANVDTYQDAAVNNKEIVHYVDKANEDLNPLGAYRLLQQLTAQDREILDITHPERLIITSVPVPPVCLRPTVSMGDAGVMEDDLTHQLSEIIMANAALKNHLDRGTPTKIVIEAWQFLQDSFALYVNSEANGLQLPKGKPIRSLCTRLKGKEGRFRGNLSGKRCDFTARTVISPDPNISVEQVVVPEWIAKRMTFPERVCEANIGRLRDAIVRGADQHPGACFIRQSDGRTRYLGPLRKALRQQAADKLQFGNVVERHMRDGDVVLFNRQPSLHRLSIMAHLAKVMPNRTFRFNECVCSPYNADFDGDEMNLHLPQTDEARAEAFQLMGVREGLVTPKNGEVVVCATQDFLTASFLLTQKDVYLTRDKFCQLCCALTDGEEHIELPTPAIMKPCEMWTGKQAFNVLLRPNRHCKVFVNLEIPEKNYTKKGESMCKNDGWVIFRNSELISGNLGKKVLGGAKNGLFFRLIRDNSVHAAVACMSRIAKLSSRWLMNRGFTIGIDDVAASNTVNHEKAKIATEKYKVVEELIASLHAGTLAPKPGCTPEQTLEALVNGELGRIRELIGNMCEARLTFMNKPRIMAECGSKGSPLNLCQMMACVGQQNVGGQRIKDGFVNRTLPHFQKGCTEPEARGFVENSFYSGLRPPEFFFHTMGGREGLVDTAVKTAETGYMARRLMKALEDLSLKYDLTVRTSACQVVQFAFGDDCLNPARMEGAGSKPLDFNYVMKHIQQVMRPPRGVVKGSVQRLWLAKGQEAKRRRTEGEKVAILPLPPEGPRGLKAVPRTPAEFRNTAYLSRPLLPTEIVALAGPLSERFVSWVRESHGNAELDVRQIEDDVNGYIQSLGPIVADKRDQLGLTRGDTPESAAAALKEATVETNLALSDMAVPTQMHLEAFINRCALKYVGAMQMPGEAVGAVAAQSIAEPATQMTLKTFHFAGVASMNVTLGVPRIKEIINAAKNISTPIITCTLNQPYSEVSARIVKGRIEPTTFGDLCLYIKEVYEPSACFLSVKVDLHTIQKLQLEVTVENMKQALLDHKNLSGIRLRAQDVEVVDRDKMRILAPQRNQHGVGARLMYFHLQNIKKALPKAVVTGIRSTNRAVINKDDKGDKTTYSLLVEGYGLMDVMSVPGIDSIHTSSNHVMEVERVLGIEAARCTIMKEIQLTMGSHGIGIDTRHVQMLGDCMTYRGMVLGINRFGISRMRTSALMLASFERTTDHIFDAAAHLRSDPVKGVSECIILGANINLGTGLFKILYDFGGRQAKPPVGAPTRTPLMSNWRKRPRLDIKN